MIAASTASARDGATEKGSAHGRVSHRPQKPGSGKAREGFFAIESDVDFLIQELIEKATAKGMTGEELAMRLVGRLRSEGRISAKAVEEVQESMQEVG